ncbi:MAG: response regulator [Rhizomicrobium sp.]
MTTESSFLVYVVDDDEAVLDSTLLLLEAEGIAAAGYRTPQEFLAGFEPARASCLLLDVHMPLLSGIELLGQLRERGVVTPAIMMTGRSDDGIEEVARRRDAALLAKPPNDDELISLVRAASRRPRAV